MGARASQKKQLASINLSKTVICKHWGRKRDYSLPAFLCMFDNESWLCGDKRDDLTCYLEVLRGGFLPDVITFVGAGTGRGLGVERERVPGSSPWLAIDVT